VAPGREVRPSAACRDRFSWDRLGPLLFCIFLPGILILPALETGSMLSGLDYGNVFYYSRGWIGKELSQGRLPLWDPATLCGFPLMAALQTAVFYPPTWLTILLPPAEFWTASVWMHISLAGIFTLAWLKRGLGVGTMPALAGAVAYMLSGPLVLRVYAGHLNHLCAYAWLPAILWMLECYLHKPSWGTGLRLGLAASMLFLTGVPQYFLIGLLALLARLGQHLFGRDSALRARLASGLGSCAWTLFGLLLCAPQILPAMELSGHAQRLSVNDYEFATSYSLPPENLLGFLVPTLHGDVVNAPYWGRWFLWEANGYIGIPALGLALAGLLGRRSDRLIWVLVAFLGILLALGRDSPVFWLFYHTFPGASLFRGPGRYLVLFVLGMAPLAAYGIEELLRQGEGIRRPFLVTAVAMAVLCLVSTVAYFVVNREREGRWVLEGFIHRSMDRNRATHQGLEGRGNDDSRIHPKIRSTMIKGLLQTVLWSGMSSILLFVRFRRGMAAVPVSWGLILITGIDLVSFGGRYFRPRPKEGMEWPPAMAEWFRKQPGYPFRLGTLGMSYISDCGRCQIGGLRHVGGYEPMLLQRYADLVNTFAGAPLENVVVCSLPAGPSPILRAMGMRFMLFPPGEPVPPNLRTGGWIGGRPIVEFPDALPLAHMASRAVVEEDRGRRLRMMMDPSVDLSRTVILEVAPNPPIPSPPLSRSQVRVREMSPGRYDIHVENDGGGYLVLAEAWYPGWRAEVDGKETEILRANHLFQAIPLGPGSHEVRFRYRSLFLVPGFLVSGTAALGVAFLWGFRRFRSPRAGLSGS